MNTQFPDALEWPKWMQLAAADIGVRELPGVATHPKIAAYYSQTALGGEPEDSSVPWCSAAVNFWMHAAGYRGTHKANARSWLGWGEKLDKPRFGCVCVFWRGNPASSQGHVGLFAGDASPGHILVLGGNQGNSVRYAEYPTHRLLGYRWPQESDRVDASE